MRNFRDEISTSFNLRDSVELEPNFQEQTIFFGRV